MFACSRLCWDLLSVVSVWSFRCPFRRVQRSVSRLLPALVIRTGDFAGLVPGNRGYRHGGSLRQGPRARSARRAPRGYSRVAKRGAVIRGEAGVGRSALLETREASVRHAGPERQRIESESASLRRVAPDRPSNPWAPGEPPEPQGGALRGALGLEVEKATTAS